MNTKPLLHGGDAESQTPLPTEFGTYAISVLDAGATANVFVLVASFCGVMSVERCSLNFARVDFALLVANALLLCGFAAQRRRFHDAVIDKEWTPEIANNLQLVVVAFLLTVVPVGDTLCVFLETRFPLCALLGLALCLTVLNIG